MTLADIGPAAAFTGIGAIAAIAFAVWLIARVRSNDRNRRR